MPNYNSYKFKKYEVLKVLTVTYVISFLIIFMFYRNVYASFFLSFLSLLYLSLYKETAIKKQKNELLLQFKDMLYSLNVALETGESVSNGLYIVLDDLSNIYKKDDYIIMELDYMLNMLKVNRQPHEMFKELATRSALDDIINFSDVFNITYKAGGNLVKVLKQTSDIITEKIELEQEVKLVFAKKEYELNAISVMPVLIFGVLSITAEEYIKPLHTTFWGYIVTTISLMIIIFAYFIARKMIDIEV